MFANRIEPELGEGLLLPGSIVGDRYEICELLAWGGMGIVYRALHLELGNADVLVEPPSPPLASAALVLPIRPIMKKKRTHEAVQLESDARNDETLAAESARPE